MVMLNNNLRIFIAVAEKGSITETAHDLFISQPAVSKSIKTLEDELHLKLFYRDKRKGLLLTDAGQKILLLSRQMVDMENRIYQTAFRENNFIGGRVRIASMPMLTSIVLSQVFHDFKKKYPCVDIELIEGSSMDIIKAVEEHQVDFGFTASPFGNLDHKVLFQDYMVAISKNKLSNSNIINILDNPEGFIFCKSGQEIVMDELRKQKINFEKSFAVQQGETVISLVDKGNGIGIISKLALSLIPNQLTSIPVHPPINIDIGLVANSLKDLTPVASELKRMIELQVQNL